ncbi:MAG: Outer membrane efflux protein BepC [Alphaproteobacteria bacterium MarineAlpha10_Bin1]|nr:MAG: Outer membrane efflux protein BepC [Alphaproteobacteria bacterium MarineAlpha10_Bin1]
MNRTERRTICGAATGLAVGFALALATSAAFAESLDEALISAYQNNPTLLAERAELRATDEGVASAQSGWRPTVQIDGDFGFSETETTTVTGGFTTKTESSLRPRSFSLSVTEPLYRGGRTSAETRSAKNLVDAGRATLAQTEQGVLLDAVTAYMDVLRTQSVVELNRHNERVVARQHQAAQDRFEVGEVTRTDVAQAEARVAQAKADRIGAEGNLISARATYRQIIGDLPGRLGWPASLAGVPSSESEALQIANVANPSIIGADFVERSARDDIDIALSDLLPQVSLRGGYDRQYDVSSVTERADSLSLSAIVTVPLYQSGAEHASVRRSKQIASQRRLEFEEARRAVLEEVTRAWEALITARAKIAAFESQVRAAELALEGVEQEVLVGLRTTLDVLDAEQELFTARVNLVGAERDAVVSSYWVKSTVGELTAEALGLSVERYDADAHYRAVSGKWFGLSAD